MKQSFIKVWNSPRKGFDAYRKILQEVIITKLNGRKPGTNQ